MLKKAGIIVAAVATGVLTVSSIAFADTSEGNLKNDCAFGNAGGNPEASAVGGNTLVSTVADIVLGAAASVTTQTNTLNCNNVQLKDLVDQGSNNESKTTTKSDVEDSFNSED